MRPVLPALLLLSRGLLPAQSFDVPTSEPPFSRPPIDSATRAQWVLKSTFGPFTLASLAIESGVQTWSNSPHEYGPHWSGFGQRLGSKVLTHAVGSATEASLGALWGEDPRYLRLGKGPKMGRLKHALAMTFQDERASGGTMPAYARFIAIPSTRLLSTTWRPESQRTTGATASGIGFSFLGRATGNTWNEFWPDLRRRLFKGNAANREK
jgi:hypothetical protein